MPDTGFESDPLVGAQMGSCKLTAMIGAGGMARVYIAKHLILRKEVAVKVLSARMSEDQEYVIRFQREAESTKKIQHPNVVRVLEFGQQDGFHYLVMEYLPGESLTTLIRRDKRLPFEQATQLLVEIAEGLEAAQAQGVIHRDIKPSNILMGKDGSPKITDFGIAREAGTARGITVEGMFVGTPEYVSPEQAEGLIVDFSTDIYSLGVSYYEMLTGKLPFSGQTHIEVAMARLKKAPKPVQEAFPGVDPRAIPIIDKMLQRDSNLRYPSATALLADLHPLVTAKKKPKAVAVEPSPDAALPGDVRWKLSGRASIMRFGPGLALLGIGGYLAPGAAGWVASLEALTKSDSSLIAAGLGFLALAWACFSLRRELAGSRSVLAACLGIVLAGAFSVVATATLDRNGVMVHLLQPVNLMLGAIGMVWAAAAASSEQDEDTPPTWIQKVVLLLAAVPWFAGAAAGNLAGPFRAISGAIEMSAALLVPMLLLGISGIIVTTARLSTRNMRRLGIGLLALASVFELIWAAAGSRGMLKTPSEWAQAVVDCVKPMPGELPRSGGLMLVAIFLVPLSLRFVRSGLIRHYSEEVEDEPEPAPPAPPG